MVPAQNMAVSVPAGSLNGSAPHCEHLAGLTPSTHQSDRCQACQDHANRGAPLVACMSCGWVACADNSPDRHARAHYEETDHPLVCGLEPGSRWKWCSVHQRLV